MRLLPATPIRRPSTGAGPAATPPAAPTNAHEPIPPAAARCRFRAVATSAPKKAPSGCTPRTSCRTRPSPQHLAAKRSSLVGTPYFHRLDFLDRCFRQQVPPTEQLVDVLPAGLQSIHHSILRGDVYLGLHELAVLAAHREADALVMPHRHTFKLIQSRQALGAKNTGSPRDNTRDRRSRS